MPMSPYLAALREKVGTTLLIMPSVTASILDDAGRLLLVRHADRGVWVAPGGAIDPEETPADAVVREVWEETGLHVEPTALLGVYSGPEFVVQYANGDRVCYVMTLFACRRLAGEPRPDGIETVAIGYYSAEEARGLVLAPWAPQILPQLFRSGSASFVPPAWSPPRESG